jgi:hypothetical protein
MWLLSTRVHHNSRNIGIHNLRNDGFATPDSQVSRGSIVEHPFGSKV